ncbi:MAG: hypothetical protein Q4C91_13230 [Eubacteriales bacterium]|nr:hypothetical protein [Eubacteriales bacterium]
MTKRKKILAVLTAGALGLMTPVSSFASDTSPKEITSTEAGSNAAQFEATGSYTGNTVQTKYRVEITWGSMEFDYAAPSSVWDADTLTYKTEGTGSFSPKQAGVSNKFSITNHSNAEIGALGNFYGTEADGNNISESIQGLITDENGYKYTIGMSTSLSSAAMGIEPNDTDSVGRAQSLSYLLKITGGALTKSDTPVSLGTLTITIS